MNSYIITPGGLSINIDGKPYAVDATHANYAKIRDAVKAKDWDAIPDLFDMVKVVQDFVSSTEVGYGAITVEGSTHRVLYNGEPLHNVIVDRLFTMLEDQFDVMPMVKFLDNLMKNPSKKAIDELYRWMEHNGMTITEDGYLLAHKRVRDDYKSFFDGTTDNSIGTTPELPRWKVDDRSEVTCSSGLHFCSQSYLPNYAGGQGRVLMLKIDPADVVSIPTDYNHAKGRACKYKIIGELKGDARVNIEDKPVMHQPVIAADPVSTLNVSDAYQNGYRMGYKAGRGKQKNEYKDFVVSPNHDTTESEAQFACGYLTGYADGRNKQPKTY